MEKKGWVEDNQLPGWYVEETSKRLVKLSCFYTNGMVNSSVRPLDGIIVAVDLDRMKIAQYHGRFMMGYDARAGPMISLASIYDPEKRKNTDEYCIEVTHQSCLCLAKTQHKNTTIEAEELNS
ncbi:hypothetical protein FNV43_RR00285 [Rhamnella rubrinervis]|uniref:Copper amine oxidase N3-terminal domain-containing protein n=1 Tax=Rhamnella rubrinervis TaxID=2594499 RepID=A0A8K0MR11_9ROSA|nr:hypothetical protein FNV43_RR00285 [Rhamnella rubrinervis]